MTPGQEKRGEPRVPLVLRVEYPGQHHGVRDTTENLSAAGLFIRTERALVVGERLPLQVSFPGLLAPVTVEVEVVRVRLPSPEGPGGVAVKVPDDRAADRATLARLAEKAGGGAGPVDLSGRVFHILVVEANPHVVEMYEYALRKLRTPTGAVEVEVRFARTGQEALVQLALAPADLVMCELNLPVLDGFALVERLRADPALAPVPVLAISTGGAEVRQRALDLGVDVYLQKPVQFADVIGTVLALLRLAS